jgi:hypothetical protein
MSRRLQIGLIALNLALAPFLRAGSSADLKATALAQIESSMAELGRITGLQALRKVQADTIDKPHLKRFVEEQIKHELKPEEIRIEEISLKKLGLVPDNFDLARSTVELMTEQAAAFYDYRKKKLFLLEPRDTDAPSSAEEEHTVLVHELAHALADQHFNLNKYLHRSKTDDSSLARMAVMEGQATWLMYEAQAQKRGASLVNAPGMVESMSRASDSRIEQYPVLSNTPLYMRASLLFPYMQGLRFQQAVQQKLGKVAFSEVFRNPPANSQQILHPEKYLSGEKATQVSLPLMPSGSQYKVLNGGTIGEFDHEVLIEQYVGKTESQSLAPHWKGGAFRLLQSKKNKSTVLLYASEWDSAANARRMFDAYKQVMAGKWKYLDVQEKSQNSVAGKGDDGFYLLRVDDAHLTSIEGMPTLKEALASLRATVDEKRNAKR